MAIIIISCSSRSLRQEMAENLTRKLGYPCLSREELTDQATEAGIPIGKLEMSIVKGSTPAERLARLKERYLAFVTKAICERAKSGNLVYHGRGAHLLLPDVSHLFRIRLMPHMEHRIQTEMLRLRMDRQKAEKYIQQVDQDIEKWIHVVYGRDIDDPKLYELILNLENMSLANASMALCSMAELPDFRPTPASLQAMDNHYLSAQSRLRLALNDRTADADLTVSANDGIVTVTYMPRQSQVAKFIPEVLSELKGVKEILVTMANTNILWIQEAYHPQSETFEQLNQVAQRWGAAVELLRFIPSAGIGSEGLEETASVPPAGIAQKREYTGGIEDDLPDLPQTDDGGVSQTMEELIRQGRSGGSHTLQGNFLDLSTTISRNVNYSLVVIGNLFCCKPKAAQIRMIRDLKIFLGERIHVPVISADELHEKYLFGYKQLVKLLIFLVLSLGIYWATFVHQEPILRFLQEYKGRRLLSTIAIGLSAPLIAYLYGTVARLFLKSIKFD
jgi:cytidylate kinase